MKKAISFIFISLITLINTDANFTIDGAIIADSEGKMTYVAVQEGSISPRKVKFRCYFGENKINGEEGTLSCEMDIETSSEDEVENIRILNNDLSRHKSFQFVYCSFHPVFVGNYFYINNSLNVTEGGEGINIKILEDFSVILK